MMVRRSTVLLALLVLFAPLAQAASPSTGSGAAVHAFLDRSHATVGDTVTLNIRSSGSLGQPDLSPLRKDFEVLDTSRSSSVQIVNGKTTSTSQIGVALKPLHAGTLTIPALAVGGGRTQPLTLQVGAAPSGGTGKVGDPVFMETSVQSSSPWVGQQTVYTVRLFYLPGVDGALSDPTVDEARLIQLDRDHRYVTQRNGYTYKVIERSWALIPQRSGEINVQGPVFQGQRLGPGFPNAWFNNPNALLNNPNALLTPPLHGFGGAVRASAPVAQIEVRAPPANAGKPWLPARSVELKLSGLPASGEVDAGTPLTVTLTVSASGQPADALPEPELPAIAGARVYPDQTRDSTNDSGKWLQGTRKRTFAIVPERNGPLTIPAITLGWWNVAQSRPAQANTPAHTLAVSGVVAGSSAPAAPPSATPASSGAPATAARANPLPGAAASSGGWWRDIALASLALWALVIVAGAAWWLSLRRRRAAAPPAGGVPTGESPRPRSELPSGTTNPLPPAATQDARVGRKALQRAAMDAARAGDAAACEHALLAWARASGHDIVNIGALRDALSDPPQRAALDALQRARWQDVDAAPACAQVLQAFADGVTWRGEHKAALRDNTLPPLYPL
ncbi:MAG: BatD family protein [Rhodanobacteraceae bacterium]